MLRKIIPRIITKNLITPSLTCFATPAKYSFDDLYNHNWLEYDPTHKKSEGTHKSKAEQHISRIPVIEVEGNIARCMGGTYIGAGHPQVYIQLNTREPSKPSVCKYCGLKYVKKHHSHEH